MRCDFLTWLYQVSSSTFTSSYSASPSETLALLGGGPFGSGGLNLAGGMAFPKGCGRVAFLLAVEVKLVLFLPVLLAVDAPFFGADLAGSGEGLSVVSPVETALPSTADSFGGGSVTAAGAWSAFAAGALPASTAGASTGPGHPAGAASGIPFFAVGVFGGSGASVAAGAFHHSGCGPHHHAQTFARQRIQSSSDHFESSGMVPDLSTWAVSVSPFSACFARDNESALDTDQRFPMDSQWKAHMCSWEHVMKARVCSWNPTVKAQMCSCLNDMKALVCSWKHAVKALMRSC